MLRIVLPLFVSLLVVRGAQAETLTYAQVLQRVVEVDASLQIANMELERVRLETDRVESQLGWTASGQGGIARDINAFGSTVDRIDAGANLDRKLESGSSVGLGVSAAREEADTSVFPFLANPSQSTRADANYRLPLAQGSDGVSYHQGVETAAAGIEQARADVLAARNALAQQVAETFYAAALTYSRLRNAEEAIQRAERLKRFINQNVRLGVSEEKDRLQAEAQWRARLAEQRTLRVTWENQRIALNRLMERAWDSEWQPYVEEQSGADPLDAGAIEREALTANPDLQRDRARLRVAESTIARRRDAARDKFDLVFSVGNRTTSGDLPAGGQVSKSEPVAAIRFEYRAALDRRGVDAELTQAYLERDVARRRMSTNETNLRYSVTRLVSEIEATAVALAQARERKDAERQKLDEATRRYRTGRASTAELIQFENDYEAAVFAVEQQTIELSRRRKELDRLRGAWGDILFTSAPPEVKP